MGLFPPPNYIQTESTNPAIELFMPRPQREEHQEVVMHKCFNCGGDMIFDVDKRDLNCTYCASTTTVCPQCAGSMNYVREQNRLECFACGATRDFTSETVGKTAQTNEFRKRFLEQSAEGWGTEHKEILCQTCGSAVIVPPESLTTECTWCGSRKIIQQKKPDDVLRPRFLLPFAVANERCNTITSEWLGNSWLLPKELQRVASVEEFQPLFIPYWTFDASSESQWQAEVGHEKQVKRNGKWETEIVWKWEGGNTSNRFSNVLVSGTTRVNNAWLHNIGRFNVNVLTPYHTKYLAGTQAMAYDTKIEDSWAVARSQMREVELAKCKQGPSTNRVRNFSMELHFDDEAWRYILVPLYVANYFYNNDPYQLLINGQTGQIAGKRPIDWRKILLTGGIPLLLGILLQLIMLIDGVPDITTVAWLLMLGGAITLVVLALMAMKVRDG